MDYKGLCMGCMTELENSVEVCGNCGYKLTPNTSRGLQPQTVLDGKYMIGKVIGEGGFGISYIAYDLVLNKRIAIKEYFPSELVTRDTTMRSNTSLVIQTSSVEEQYKKGLDRFAKEAENLAKFNNLPGIVSVKDFFYENNTAYMVMEYIDGITLSQYLSEHGNKLPYDQVINLMKPVMESLQTVHNAGIIHRDISPDNIMITTSGEMKLIDFGAARFVGNNDAKSLTVILKHGYAPPEQYQTDGKQGPWTDVYALAATIYRMLSGNVPMEAPERIIRGDKPDDIPDVSKAVLKTIMRGMDLNIDRRFRSISDFSKALMNGKNDIKPLIIVMGAVAGLIIILLCISILSMKNRGNAEKAQDAEREEYDSDNVEKENDHITEDDAQIKTEEASEDKELIQLTEDELYNRIRKISGNRLEDYNFIRKYEDYDGDGIKELFVLYSYVDYSYYTQCYREVWYAGDGVVKKVYDNTDVYTGFEVNNDVTVRDGFIEDSKAFVVCIEEENTIDHSIEDKELEFYVIDKEPVYIKDESILESYYDKKGSDKVETDKDELLKRIEQQSGYKAGAYIYEDFNGDGIKELFTLQSNSFEEEMDYYFWPALWFADCDMVVEVSGEYTMGNTFYTPAELVDTMILSQYGRYKQCILYPFGTGSYVGSFSIGFDGKDPYMLELGEIYVDEQGRTYDHCQVETMSYSGEELGHAWWPYGYFEIYYMNGEYYELASTAISESELKKYGNYEDIMDQIYKDMDAQLIYEDVDKKDISKFQKEQGRDVIPGEIMYSSDGYIYYNFENWRKYTFPEGGVAAECFCNARLKVLEDNTLQYDGLFDGYKPERGTTNMPYYPNMIGFCE